MKEEEMTRLLLAYKKDLYRATTVDVRIEAPAGERGVVYE